MGEIKSCVCVCLYYSMAETKPKKKLQDVNIEFKEKHMNCDIQHFLFFLFLHVAESRNRGFHDMRLRLTEVSFLDEL